MSIDISDLPPAEPLLAGHVRILELLAAGSPLPEVLEALTRFIDDHSTGGSVSSVLLVDAGGEHLSHAAAPGLPDEYRAAIDGLRIGPEAGSCGTAAHRRERVVVRDIATDPLWRDFRDLAARHGLRACWSTPILGTDGQLLGTFATYYREAREPSVDELQLIELVTRTAALAIERDRADALRAELLERERLARADADRARAEAERDRRRLRDLFMEAPALVAVFRGPEHVIELVNPRYLATVGRTEPAELVGRPIREALPEFEEQGFFKLLDRVYASGEPFVGTESAARLQEPAGPGDERFFDFVYQPSRDASGAVDGILAHAVDVTEKVRGRMALEEAHTRLLVREQQQAAVAALGQRALQNAGGLGELFGEAVQAVQRTLGSDFTKVLELLPDGRSLRLVAGVGWSEGLVGRATVGAGRDSQAGYTLISAQPVVVEDLASEARFSGPPLLLEHGVVSGMSVVIAGRERPFGVIGTHTQTRRAFTEDDVHFLQSVANVLGGAVERHQAEDALRERDDRLELTLAASNTGAWEWDIEHDRVVWSKEISALHGTPEGWAPSGVEEYLALIHPDDRDRMSEAIRSALEDGTLEVEFRLVRPDGSVRWAIGAARTFTDQAGRAVRMLGIARDITDRRLAEEERDRLTQLERQAQLMREAFIGVVSHELRTPITTIYAGAKLLTRPSSGLDPDERAAVLRDVAEEADRLYRLVEDLLVLTRAERGNLELGEDPLQLARLLERVRSAEAARWPEITFRLALPDDLPTARGEETYVEQVVRNLLSNAAKYSPPGSTVEVAASADDEVITIAVRDQGAGISADEAGRLFELFYRSPTTAGTASGAGIGLFVSQRLVEAMGGRISARPRPEGGSEFSFTLRRYEADEERLLATG